MSLTENLDLFAGAFCPATPNVAECQAVFDAYWVPMINAIENSDHFFEDICVEIESCLANGGPSTGVQGPPGPPAGPPGRMGRSLKQPSSRYGYGYDHK